MNKNTNEIPVVPAVPDVKEEEWKLENEVWLVDPTGFSFKCASRLYAVDLKKAVNASIQRVLEKASTLSDNVKAQPDQGEKHVWECGCGTINGVNLAACGVCNRPRGEGEVPWKQEAVADSVKAQGQLTRDLDSIELAQDANGGEKWRKDCCRCEPEVGAAPCEYCAIHHALAIARKAFSVLLGGGSDASRVSSQTRCTKAPHQFPECGATCIHCGETPETLASSANAQGPMEDTARLNWLLDPENLAMCITDELNGDWVVDRADIDAAMDLPSAIKEHPAKQDLETDEYFKEEERVGAIYSVKDLEEKEAVTRNTAVLQMARYVVMNAKEDHIDHACVQCCPDSEYAKQENFICSVHIAKRLLSEADGQPESATGASSQTVLSPKQELFLHQHMADTLPVSPAPSPLLDSGEQKE